MPAIDFITELIPTYLERITLAVGGAIGGAWAVAFDGVHLSIDWLLVFMFSDYIAGLYKAFALGEYSSSKCANGLIMGKTTSDATISGFTGITRVEYNKASAFIEQLSASKVKIRVSIVKYVSATGAYGGGGEKEVVRTKPQVYQDIFNKIEQSLFLKKNL